MPPANLTTEIELRTRRLTRLIRGTARERGFSRFRGVTSSLVEAANRYDENVAAPVPSDGSVNDDQEGGGAAVAVGGAPPVESIRNRYLNRVLDSPNQSDSEPLIE